MSNIDEIDDIETRAPTIEEEDLASHVIFSKEDLKKAQEERKREYTRIKRRDSVKRWLSAGVIIGLTGTVIAQGFAMVSLFPLKELVPIVVYQRSDGTVQTTIKWEDLPEQVREDTVINVVWNYVQLRESWSEGNSHWTYKVVSAMSSEPVRDTFRKWYDSSNPNSPARMYKDGTTVQAEYVAHQPVCPPLGCSGSPPAYRIWFDRFETRPGEVPMNPVRYAVTVRIKRNVPLPEDRAWQRWTFNAPLIQVIEYPGAAREGIAQ